MEANAYLFGASDYVWSEQSRYKPCGSQKPNVVKTLISLLKDEEGLLKWIEKN